MKDDHLGRAVRLRHIALNRDVLRAVLADEARGFIGITVLIEVDDPDRGGALCPRR